MDKKYVRGLALLQEKARTMGRYGTRLVMGSKNLKTIVAGGSGFIKVADSAWLMAAVAANRKKAHCNVMGLDID